MLSIVQMNLDSDMDVMDVARIKSEEIDIVEEPLVANRKQNLSDLAHSLELIPIVYTTKLDDMVVLKSHSRWTRPSEVTARILKESKPILRSIPSQKRRRNRRKFTEMEARLAKIYCAPRTMNSDDEIDIKPDISWIQIDLNSIKSEIVEPSSENAKDTCNYSELLKQCKPCSVVLPRLNVAKHVTPGSRVRQANEVGNKNILRSLLTESLSDEEQPLITLQPDLLVERKVTNVVVKPKERTKNSGQIEKLPKWSPKMINLNSTNQSEEKNILNISTMNQRLMRNGLLEMHDLFSKECTIYCTDTEGNLFGYYRNIPNKYNLYDSLPTVVYVGSKYKIENCCWVSKNESLQLMYPKFLIYSSAKFMRKPHPCKPGACICCCRKKENITKPKLLYIDDHPSASLVQEDLEILDLEDEIDKSIIDIKNKPELNISSSDWLLQLSKRNTYSKVPKTLIDKALTYKKPDSIKPKINRRLVTLGKGDSQRIVIIIRNYVLDVTEIYDINESGDLCTYIKTTCYGNTSQPDVNRLLKKPNAISEVVCCWYKREEVITKLNGVKNLRFDTVQFIRTNHTCPSDNCSCCCTPIVNIDINFRDIELPPVKDWCLTQIPNISLIRAESLEDFLSPQPSTSFATSPTRPELAGTAPLPYISLVSPQNSKAENEDDCQITSVMTSPSLRTIPQTSVKKIPAATSNLQVTEVVDNNELSQEVNSLITSILERFKDVRLTINSDGKVAAALNTPVNTLSTVELKVLANILSFAQTQVNSLGSNVNSGMSLSNIINLKVNDVNKSSLDPNSVYKAFGKDVNLNNKLQSIKVKIAPSPLPRLPEKPTVQQTCNFFSNSTSVRTQQFNESFSSFISSKMGPDPSSSSETATPVIENVFSLKQEPEAESTTVWYRKPAAQPSVSTLYEDTIKTLPKRKDDIELPMVNPKKIKILSPATIGVTTNVSQSTITMTSHPVPQVAAGGFYSEIPVLANNNFQLVSTTQGSMNTIPSVAQPVLIINPLNTGNVTNPASLKVQNMVSMSQSQLNMPVFINPAVNTNIVNTENANVPIVPGFINPVATEAILSGIPDVEDTLVEPKEEYCEGDFPVENCADDLDDENCADNELDAENCVEPGQDEEDCILGF